MHSDLVSLMRNIADALGYSDGAQKTGPNPDIPMIGVTLKHWIGAVVYHAYFTSL